jgi:hypothetical protein
MPPQPASQDDMTTLLARAFSTAWKRYYLPGRSGTISEDVARYSLARHLVSMVKDGVNDEDALVTGGLLYLVSLGPEEPPRGMAPTSVAERNLRRTLTEGASRVAIAVGISAILAFVFIALVVPKSQKSDAGELPDFKKSDLSEPTSDHLTLEPVEPTKMTPDEAQALLERLKQWQLRR